MTVLLVSRAEAHLKTGGSSNVVHHPRMHAKQMSVARNEEVKGARK